MSSSWFKTAIQRSKAAWQVLTQNSSTASVGVSDPVELSKDLQACSADASCVNHTCTSSACTSASSATFSCTDATEATVHDHESSVNTKIQQAQESVATEHDLSAANHKTETESETETDTKTEIETETESETERTRQVLRFTLSSEIMHLSTDGTYVYPVKTPEQLIQENIGKIALLQRSMDASELEFKYLVQPMIYACARMCLMLPGSNHHHDSFAGGLFAHNLNLALTALDKLHQFDTKTGSKRDYSLATRCSVREELMYKFKLNSIVSQDDARCFAEIWSLSQQQRLAKEQEFYQYDNLNIQSSAALNYLQHTFASLLEFDSQYLSKVSPDIKCRWESFMPHKCLTLKLPDSTRSTSTRSSFLACLASAKASSTRAAQLCNLKIADTALQEIHLRQERLNLLNSLLPVPQLKLTTFEALLKMLPSEAKSAVECFGVKEQLYRNSCYEREALLPYALGLCEDEFELEQLAKLALQGYSQDEQQFLLRQKSSLNFAAPITKMRTELSNSHPHLSSSQLNFAMQMMCLFAALTHDLGKVIHDLEILADNGEKFNAAVDALADFVGRTQTKVLYVRFKESRGVEHNNLILHGSWLFARECPHSFDFVAHYFNLDQIFGSRIYPVISIIKSADILSAALFKEHPISPYLLQTVLAEAVVKAYCCFKLDFTSAQKPNLHKKRCSKPISELDTEQAIELGESTGDKCTLKITSGIDAAHKVKVTTPAFNQTTPYANAFAKSSVRNTFSLCDYLRLHKGVNDLYSEIYVRSRDVLIVMRSAMEAELAAALNIAQKGELGRLSLMTCIPSWSCTLVRTGISPIVTSTRRLSFFKVRCGQDLVIVRGFDVTMQAFEISQNVAQADYQPISKDDHLLQYLLQGLRYLSKEVLKVFQEVKNYTQLDDCAIEQVRQKEQAQQGQQVEHIKPVNQAKQVLQKSFLKYAELDDYAKDASEDDSIYKTDIQVLDYLIGGKALGSSFSLDAHFMQAVIDEVELIHVAFQLYSAYDYAYLGCTWMLQSRDLKTQEFCLLTY